MLSSGVKVNAPTPSAACSGGRGSNTCSAAGLLGTLVASPLAASDEAPAKRYQAWPHSSQQPPPGPVGPFLSPMCDSPACGARAG